MATVLLPGSLIALFPGSRSGTRSRAARSGRVLAELDGSIPGMRDRLVEAGPRLRPHINVFVDGQPADLATGCGDRGRRPRPARGKWRVSRRYVPVQARRHHRRMSKRRDRQANRREPSDARGT